MKSLDCTRIWEFLVGTTQTVSQFLIAVLKGDISNRTGFLTPMHLIFIKCTLKDEKSSYKLLY